VPAEAAAVAGEAAAARSGFSYAWDVAPSTVFVGSNSSTPNGLSTGSVILVLSRGQGAAPRLAMAAGTSAPILLETTSSAIAAQPDRFHATFTLRLRLKDDATGATGEVAFKATLSGALTEDHSSLVVRLLSPQRQRLVLGNHVYTVSMPAALHPLAPSDVTAQADAFVQVGPRWR
jgi:hypothetical protein